MVKSILEYSTSVEIGTLENQQGILGNSLQDRKRKWFPKGFQDALSFQENGFF